MFREQLDTGSKWDLLMQHGAEEPPKQGEEAGPKNPQMGYWSHRLGEGESKREQKKVIFNHGVSLRQNGMVNTPAFLTAWMLHLTEAQQDTFLATHQIARGEAGVTPQGVRMKRKTWSVKESIVDVYCTTLRCSSGGGRKARAPLLQMCVIHLFIQVPGGSGNPLCVCARVCMYACEWVDGCTLYHSQRILFDELNQKILRFVEVEKTIGNHIKKSN